MKGANLLSHSSKKHHKKSKKKQQVIQQDTFVPRSVNGKPRHLKHDPFMWMYEKLVKFLDIFYTTE